ncbi:MAG: S-methyl-5-thioribose-1-phosphate isomerase [Myxococcota bacterium]
MSFRTLHFRGDHLVILDQRRLPAEETYLELRSADAVAEAIRTLAVRGAPAIGIAAAYGVVLAAQAKEPLGPAIERLRSTRPTAVNLAWALERMKTRLEASFSALCEEAEAIYAEEVAASRAMGEVGAALIPDGARVLTHCNAGALATAELGTALAVIRAAVAQGKRLQVFADETRPVLQGARLTAWELMKDGIPVTLIPDVAAGHLIGRGEIDCAIVGADRIAASGDVANKIGTRSVAANLFLAQRPLYVAAPWSTVDLSTAHGGLIPIEERDPSEVTHVLGTRIAPLGVPVRNPAFDVTPAAWVRAIITERGLAEPELGAALARLAKTR